MLPPTLLQHEYRCPRHGEVAGLGPALPFAPDEADRLAGRSEVPIWFPQPLPTPWLVTGLRWAEDPRGRVGAVAVGFTGRGLTDGPTDVVIVAEQPGCGLGAAFAGLPDPDPGQECFSGPAVSRIHAGQRWTGLWSAAVPSDRVAFVGEADGDWLWIIGWPASAWGLVADDLRLGDARSDPAYRQYPVGALNPRLTDAGGSRSEPGLRRPGGEP